MLRFSLLSCLQLSVPPWTVACQASLSMGFSREEHCSGLPLPSPGDLLDPGVKPLSPALASKLCTTESPWELISRMLRSYICRRLPSSGEIWLRFLLPASEVSLWAPESGELLFCLDCSSLLLCHLLWAGEFRLKCWKVGCLWIEMYTQIEMLL